MVTGTGVRVVSSSDCALYPLALGSGTAGRDGASRVAHGSRVESAGSGRFVTAQPEAGATPLTDLPWLVRCGWSKRRVMSR